MGEEHVVCVVDDDESVRESLAGLLESLGFVVRPFCSGDEFLAARDIEAADCVVLDMSMPGMGGEEVQQHLIAAGSTLPILFISAHADEALERRVLERGARGYLVKPFEEEEFVLAVRAATAEKRADRRE
jgi:FixJ family two-component response regulator